MGFFLLLDVLLPGLFYGMFVLLFFFFSLEGKLFNELEFIKLVKTMNIYGGLIFRKIQMRLFIIFNQMLSDEPNVF